MNEELAREQAAKEFAERLSNYPLEEQIAVGVISKNVLNGCSWEFVRSNADIKNNLQLFAQSKTCSVQEVAYNKNRQIYGYLVYMQLDRLLEILGKEAPGLIDAKDLQYAAEHHKKAVIDLSKLMQKKYKGKIGVYCTNDSSTITVDGKTYPAFAVTLKELLQVCVNNGYGVVIANIVRDPQEVYKRADAILKASTVAPSSNAIFFDIAPLK